MEVYMRKTVIIVFLISIFTFTLSLTDGWAQKTPLEKAYSLYFQGRMEEAISLMKGHAEGNPDARTYYFIGYAYYKMKKMDMAREYFDKAYQIDPFYVPAVPKEKK
ncbi:MAG: tetratricopeptide repeat protein [Nitrospiraceae bacterium]|nr:MAG: tetratricopeptide repeat protein [Nitrospiraceae bacterium]